MNPTPTPQKPSWKNRRRAVFGTMFFCASVILYLLLFGEDTALNESIANHMSVLAGMVVIGYIAGGVWGDKDYPSS